MKTFKPASLKPAVIAKARNSGMNTEALAKAFNATPEQLRDGLAGKPADARLVVGIAKAYGMRLSDVSEFRAA